MTGETASTEPNSRPTLRIDPHVHTVASHDGHVTPERLVERAIEVGLDGVVVTDHDTVEGARIAAGLAPEEELLVVVGCEVSTAGGHLLALGVEDAVEPGRPLAETARRIRAEGGLAVVPHPFQRSRHGASASTIDDVDGIEVYNAHTLTGFRNDQAARFAASQDYPGFGGSDAHRVGGIGRAATEVTLAPGARPTVDRLLAAMRAGRTAAVGGRTAPWRYLGTVVENVTRRTGSIL
jgi:predicted metal-dependent phosphoesterase TrpH